ncbi:DNA-binding XRE family transcriptional regulator [Bradyrhizobium sp. S3.14.4]
MMPLPETTPLTELPALDAPQLRRGAVPPLTKLLGEDQKGRRRQATACDRIAHDLRSTALEHPGGGTAPAERLEDALDRGQKLEPRIIHADDSLHVMCNLQNPHIDDGLNAAFTPIMPPRMADQIKEIGNRLRWLREAKQLNQATFCRLVKIEQQAWNNYERGFRRISVDQALKVCAATGASLDFIYRDIRSALPAELAMQIDDQQRKEAKRR